MDPRLIEIHFQLSWVLHFKEQDKRFISKDWYLPREAKDQNYNRQ